MAKRILLVLVFLMCAGSLWAADSFLVGDISFEGNRRTKPESILSTITLRAGQTISTEQIDEAIQQIYRMGRFSDVAAEMLDVDGANILKFHLIERPLVRNIRFEGNDELTTDRLQGVIAIKVPDIYDPFEVEKSIKAIKTEYVKDGYYAAEVTADGHVNADNEALVTFRIKEGSLVRIKSIRFAGNSVFDADELKDSMDTQEKWFLSWLTGRGNYDEMLLAQDLERLADRYFNVGYVRVKVREPVISLIDDSELMLLLIQIDEGEQYRLGKIDAQGDMLKRKGEILNMIDLEPGNVFSREKLRDGVVAVTDLYADQGYAYANVAPLTRVDDNAKLVDVMLEIEQGPKVYIDRINITGNTKTRDKVIRREMKVVEGQLYNATALKTSRARINNLGFFEAVDLTTSEGRDQEHINVDVGVTERATGTFSVGAGYSTADGVVGQGSITQENFLGRGLRLNLAASLGSSSTTYQVGLTDPYFMDTKYTLGGDLYRTEREWTDFSRRATGGAIKLGFPVFENSRMLFIYRYEQKDIYDVDIYASQDLKDEEGTSSISSLTSNYTRNTTDNHVDPKSGGNSDLSWELAGLGGTEKFSKYVVDHRHFWPWRWSTVFSAHAQVGYVHELNDKELPIDERFYLGGINTLRGFETREVGPREEVYYLKNVDTDGDGVADTKKLIRSGEYEYTGGSKEAFANFEFIFPLYDELKIKGVTFFDIGNAWGSGEDMFSSWRYSAGAGIRWLSPMGPLRLEWGYNLDAEDWEDTSRFEFMVGRFF